MEQTITCYRVLVIELQMFDNNNIFEYTEYLSWNLLDDECIFHQLNKVKKNEKVFPKVFLKTLLFSLSLSVTLRRKTLTI